ncbi:DUF3426 domain-containing protein [Coralloluteibacterium thermophilus]|uniref:DUF3426 domain-containing protein n=1 Tax=Coralloluteibacterium thermophilum TaxID=2707049 RepID=A0ABV9NGW0_9GAMM
MASDRAPADDAHAQGVLFEAPPEADPAPPPRFARVRAVAPHRAGWRWWLAAGLLLPLLVAQSVLADRQRLAADARWRPALERICATLGCSLRPWHAPQQFSLTSRDVRPHPSVPDALLITASFRNDARFEQDWPLLELRMSDLDGQVVAQRRFTPREYLGAQPPRPTLAPRQSASLTIEVVDPGSAAVAFEFAFL